MTFNTLFSSILLQLGLATLGLAAPVSTEALDNSWQYGTGGGLLGLVVLILDIIVFGMSHIVHASVDTDSVNSRGLEVEPHARAEAHLVLGRLPLPRHRHDHLLSLLEPVCLPARFGLRDFDLRVGVWRGTVAVEEKGRDKGMAREGRRQEQRRSD